jgi:hypothetical protein
MIFLSDTALIVFRTEHIFRCSVVRDKQRIKPLNMAWWPERLVMVYSADFIKRNGREGEI